MLTITKTAEQKFKAQLEHMPDAIGIILGVKKTGCSGFSYTIDYVFEESYTDILIKLNNYMYIDPAAVLYLKGITIDYVKKGLNEVFDFINPNEKAKCGCGESFTV